VDVLLFQDTEIRARSGRLKRISPFFRSLFFLFPSSVPPPFEHPSLAPLFLCRDLAALILFTNRTIAAVPEDRSVPSQLPLSFFFFSAFPPPLVQVAKL